MNWQGLWMAFIFGISLGLISGVDLIRSDYREAAIKNNCAAYDSKTGKFQWTGNKE